MSLRGRKEDKTRKQRRKQQNKKETTVMSTFARGSPQTRHFAERQQLPRGRCYPRNCQQTVLHAVDLQSFLAMGDWMVECLGSHHMMQSTWMAHPNQANRPPDLEHVSAMGFSRVHDSSDDQAANRDGSSRHNLQRKDACVAIAATRERSENNPVSSGKWLRSCGQGMKERGEAAYQQWSQKH